MSLALMAGSAQGLLAQTATVAPAPTLQVTRIGDAPLITVKSSPTLAGNVNGPSLIRVPDFLPHPLGKYYLYFANHKGRFIRLAYADAVTGPWKIYERGVLADSATQFTRPQPDPPGSPVYTHVASPDVYVDAANKRLIMWVHGMWTDGKRWPDKQTDSEALTWLSQNHYEQRSQAFDSTDGIHWTAHPALTRLPYLRVFPWDGMFYAVGRAGKVARTSDPYGAFEVGKDLLRKTAYAGRARHEAVLVRGKTMYLFFTAIGDLQEHILVSTVDLSGPWEEWAASTPQSLLSPERSYECADLPKKASGIGDLDDPANQIRDPGIFEDGGKIYLLYSTCGEQGLALAEVKLPPAN